MGQEISRDNYTGISGPPIHRNPMLRGNQGIHDLNVERTATLARISAISRRAGADRQEDLDHLQRQVMRMNSAQIMRLNNELLSEVWDKYGAEVLGVIIALAIAILISGG